MSEAELEESEEQFPKRFGKYTLLRRLAVGGMAELFLALQRSVAGFEKLIVVKRILPRLANDEAFVEMLLQEARIAATLTHPNIAQVYDIGVVQGDYYIAMEHVHGEDLRSIIRQMRHSEVRSFPIEHSIAIALGCCKGLAHAHDGRDLDGNPLEIVHRDVSPQNVLVTFTGEVKLVDFGIAKAATSNPDDHKKLKGKLAYMSPEQARREPLDGRSDVFALGIILFELSTGKRLFRSKTEEETLERVKSGDVPDPKSLNPNMPDALAAIIGKALKSDVADRYENARAMQADLEELIRQEQLVVSALSLGEWMKTLFAEKLDEQKRMLQEGRQLAEVLAAQAPADEDSLYGHSLSGVSHSGLSTPPSSPPDEKRRTFWPVLLLLPLIAFAFWWTQRPRTQGNLSVQSAPPGASVTIDGESRGETPLDIDGLALGPHRLVLSLEGYEPFEEEFSLSETAPSLAMRPNLRAIEEENGALQVRTTPPGAQLIVDGQVHSALSPSTIGGLSTGEHHLIVQLDGYQRHEESVALTANALEEISVELELSPLREDQAELAVTLEPEGAEASLDEQVITGGSIRTTPGRHVLRVAAEGHRSVEIPVDLGAGERETLTVRLETLIRTGGGSPMGGMGSMGGMSSMGSSGPPGALTFDARPWCIVSVDGRRLGQTPIVNVPLSSGSHTVSCANPELNVTRRVNITVRPGETTRRRISLAE